MATQGTLREKAMRLHWLRLEPEPLHAEKYSLSRRQQFLDRHASNASTSKRTSDSSWSPGIAKLEFYNHLRKTLEVTEDGEILYPAGYIHLPKVDAEFVQQLCSEQLVTRRDRNGYPVREWQKIRERNEALDCMVGAYAAFKGLNRNQFPPPCGQRTDLPKAARPTLTPSTNVSPVDKPAPPAKPLERAAPPRPQSDYWASRRKDAWRRL